MINVLQKPRPLTFEIQKDASVRAYRVTRSDSNLIRFFASLDAAECYAKEAACRGGPALLVVVDSEGYTERRVTL